jgi:hypothetical protein
MRLRELEKSFALGAGDAPSRIISSPVGSCHQDSDGE